MCNTSQLAENSGRAGLSMYLVFVSLLLGGSLIAFLLGVLSNQDVCFAVAIALFLAGLLLTVAWARTSKPARWLLACLVGMTLFGSIQYVIFRHHIKESLDRERQQLRENMIDKHRAEPKG